MKKETNIRFSQFVDNINHFAHFHFANQDATLSEAVKRSAKFCYKTIIALDIDWQRYEFRNKLN